MSRYILFCTIDPTRLDIFGRLRAEHYAFLIAEQHRIVFGGPARITDGGRPETMVIVVEAESLAQAEAFIASEPYNASGGFSQVVVRPWSQVLPETQPNDLRLTYEAEIQHRREA